MVRLVYKNKSEKNLILLFTIPFNWYIIIIEGEEIKNMTTCMFKGKIKDYDYKIEFYRPEHIVDDDLDFDISWGDSFFVKDDDGQVWFVHTNED